MAEERDQAEEEFWRRRTRGERLPSELYESLDEQAIERYITRHGWAAPVPKQESARYYAHPKISGAGIVLAGEHYDDQLERIADAVAVIAAVEDRPRLEVIARLRGAEEWYYALIARLTRSGN